MISLEEETCSNWLSSRGETQPVLVSKLGSPSSNCFTIKRPIQGTSTTNVHTQVHTIQLHVFPELQLQYALLVFEFQLSRPERKTNISWVMSTLHPAIAAGHHQALWQIESGCKEDWLLPRWDQTITAVFWGWSPLLWLLYSQCDYTGFYCASLFEFMSEPTKVHTYATMRSDSSETNAFFSWTSWIHCSIISGEPLLPGSGKIQFLSICVWCTSVC